MTPPDYCILCLHPIEPRAWWRRGALTPLPICPDLDTCRTRQVADMGPWPNPRRHRPPCPTTTTPPLGPSWVDWLLVAGAVLFIAAAVLLTALQVSP